MHHEFTESGLTLKGAGGRIAIRSARPAALVDVGSGAHWWRPGSVISDGPQLTVGPGPGGLVVELEVQQLADYPAERIDLSVRARNTGSAPIRIDRLVALSTSDLIVGGDSRRWRSYRNGYQSWAGTLTIGMDERDYDLPTRLARTGGTDARHPSPTSIGHVRSDTIGAICDPATGDSLAVTQLNAAAAFGFVELIAPHGVLENFSVWLDLDGVELGPGEATSDYRFAVVTSTGPNGAWTALAAAADAAGDVMDARGRDGEHPGGWCSWYYYFAKVTQADVERNLEVLAVDGRNGPEFGCEYAMIDDGHQRAIGDWLDTKPAAFPDGMASLATQITDAGFDAGIWWAPFLVDPRSDVAQAHPEWLVRGKNGRPIAGILNPVWSPTRPMRVLDTTNPEVLAHIEEVAGSISEWGYKIQKLDFLYAAALPGVRQDPLVNRAQSLRMGLEAVRTGAGAESFLLGCGCPFGPAVGVVDAMRVGADVTPYWSNLIDRVGGRGRHGLSTRNAVVDSLTRSVFDGRWWANDPDCLMVRDSDTRLSDEEVQTLATVIGLTDGMAVLSDRMDLLPQARREMVAKVRLLAGGRPEVLDLFEQARPELVVARRSDGIDVGVLNMADESRRVVVDLKREGLLLDPRSDGIEAMLRSGEVTEFWSGEMFSVDGGLVDLGELPPHAARVLRIRF